MNEKPQEINSLKLIIYKLIMEKHMNKDEIEVMERIIEEIDYP